MARLLVLVALMGVLCVGGILSMRTDFRRFIPNPGGRRGPNRNGNQRNSGGFNVERLMEDIFNGIPGVDNPMTLKRKSREGRRVFADVDNRVRNDEQQQNVRSIVGGAENNNEFVEIDNVREAGLAAESQANVLVTQSGQDADEAFDANGAPQTQEVAEVSVKVAAASNCVFDKANTDPCVSKFREPTGRCSHLEEGRRTWGMAGTPYARLLPNKYENGIDAVRRTQFSSGEPLPSARRISNAVTTTSILLHDELSAQIMQWGQFMAHEFTLIAESEENVECCADKVLEQRRRTQSSTTLEQVREEINNVRGHICIAIENRNDTVFGDHICMHQIRSASSPAHDCGPGPRQQVNTITHFIDASAIYGSSQAQANALRSFQDGKMKVQNLNGHILPPQDNSRCPASRTARCPFLAGDKRINATPNLIATHTMFIVLHNKFAERLQAINPHWDDERLYQETRRIIAAIQTAIHYHEYLPIILGETHFTRWIGGYNGYKSEVNPSLLNELAAGAMRFGHSLIDGIFFTVDDNGRRRSNPLRTNFFNHELVYEQGAASHLRGLQLIAPWKADDHFPAEMRDHLFNKDLDIVSLNINRGRDHGFASYNDYRRHYNLPVASSWAELGRTHPAHVVASLQQVYSTVEDIELYIGGVTELPTATGLVGDLFASILGDGFSRLRDGDRLYYASDESGLTRDQINAVEHFSLAQVLCEGGGLTSTSRRAFFQPSSPESATVDCSTFATLDLNLWHDDPVVEEVCEWQIIDKSKCCMGSRTVTRQCVGESATCQCEGEVELTESCPPCGVSDWVCIGQQYQCDWANSWRSFGK